MSEFEKRIKQITRHPSGIKNFGSWILIEDLPRISDEAKKDFPKFKVINVKGDQMVIDSYVDEFFDWFEKWFGEQKMSDETTFEESKDLTYSPTYKPLGIYSVPINIPKPNTEIWISENVCINCRVKYRWWNKLFLKLILGWEVKEVKRK